MSILIRAVFLAGLSFWLSSAQAGVDAADENIAVPYTDKYNDQEVLRGHICRPAGVQKPQLVVLNHGSPPNAADRVHMEPIPCHNEAVGWFLQRHYAVVIVLRTGYGATGGLWTEGNPHCNDADYYSDGMDTAREIDAIVNYAVTLPDVDPQGVIVVGHSAGGWGTVAYDSMPHPHVTAFINMAGGRGGHYHNAAFSNCHPERLVQAMTRFGETATTPMLWVYAANDSFFGPDLASQMLANFKAAGGKADMFSAGACGTDGHHLFMGSGGSAIWRPQMDAYLASQH
jgi:dienelactone hydrolase